MIQFVRFATHDPEGFALIRLDSITGIASTANLETCRIITKEDEYLVVGTIAYFIETFGSFVGSEYNAVFDSTQSETTQEDDDATDET